MCILYARTFLLHLINFKNLFWPWNLSVSSACLPFGYPKQPYSYFTANKPNVEINNIHPTVITRSFRSSIVWYNYLFLVYFVRSFSDIECRMETERGTRPPPLYSLGSSCSLSVRFRCNGRKFDTRANPLSSIGYRLVSIGVVAGQQRRCARVQHVQTLTQRVYEDVTVQYIQVRSRESVHEKRFGWLESILLFIDLWKQLYAQARWVKKVVFERNVLFTSKTRLVPVNYENLLKMSRCARLSCYLL